MNDVIFENNRIIIDNVSHFDLAQTLDCGQAFRWKQDEKGHWCGIAAGQFARLYTENGKIIIENISKESFKNFWENYFDLKRDYGEVIAEISENEKIAAMIKTTDFSDEKYITIVTKNGKIKRSNLSLYKNVRKNGLIAIGLDEGDEIAGVRMTDGHAKIFIATRNGMAICIEEDKGRSLSRSAHGVKAIKLREGDYVVSIAKVREGASLLTVTENGYGKRTPLENYRIQGRGGYGLANYKVDDIRGYVCGIKIVDEDDDIILISSDGVIIRILAKDIRITGRTAKGVRVMRVGEGAKVVAFTRAEHDENARTEKVEQLTEEQARIQDEQAAIDEQNEIIIDTEPDDEEE